MNRYEVSCMWTYGKWMGHRVVPKNDNLTNFVGSITAYSESQARIRLSMMLNEYYGSLIYLINFAILSKVKIIPKEEQLTIF